MFVMALVRLHYITLRHFHYRIGVGLVVGVTL